MSEHQPPIATRRPDGDRLWQAICAEATSEVQRDPFLAPWLEATILTHQTLEDALAHLLAQKLATGALCHQQLAALMAEALASSPGIRQAVRADLRAVLHRDPAATTYCQPFLFAKGFAALEAYRVGYWLWRKGRRMPALFLQERISEVFAVDIHPAARLGKGILIDHATGLVIGETAVVDDNVSMLHEVTLGGTGKESGDRHPKVRQGVLIGAGAKILGNVQIGEGAKVGAGSVVLSDVAPHCTVAGVPARVVGKVRLAEPAFQMNHHLPDDSHEAAARPQPLSRR